MQHGGLIEFVDSVDDSHARIADVDSSPAVDSHIVRKDRRLRRSILERRSEIDHREASARFQIVDPELGLPRGSIAKARCIGIRHEQSTARFVNLDSHAGDQLRIVDDSRETAVSVQRKDRAFTQRTNEKACARLIEFNAFRGEQVALRDDGVGPPLCRLLQRRRPSGNIGLGPCFFSTADYERTTHYHEDG